MLTGRESLNRLIGKRRKNLSLSDSNSSLLLNSNSKFKNTQNSPILPNKPSSFTEENETLDWVNCPVCGNAVRGTDYIVNSHLDACLSRGTKRKLTQCTLLQFSFRSRSNGDTCLGEPNNLEDDVRQGVSGDESETSSIHELDKFGAYENSGRNECKSDSLYFIGTTLESCDDVSVENFIRNDAISCKKGGTLSPPSCPPNIKMPKLDICSAGIDISVAALETYIVGRRFSDEVELKEGANVCVLRDPENVKDPNAVKVICTDSGCRQMLGFLPRELAKYLSPLIEKYCLRFEGSVTSLPKHSLDAVPIRLVGQELITACGSGFNDRQVFESLWENAVRVVEYAKSFPPSITKYQRNFHVLIQEVLEHHIHLFAEDEKRFLGSFASLSDDSQRLFIRLYTRKGPWFRMSSVSYPEISDSRRAVEELSGAGYICSLKSTNELSECDLKGVLDVLTAFELREISSLTLLRVFLFFWLKLQKSIRCTRKQELIEWLLAAYKDGTCPMLPSIVSERMGICVRISSTAEFLLWRIQRLFFLNGEQDLSAFLLVDLGLVKYPDYNCNISHHIFPGRSELLAYEEAIEVAQIMDQFLDENNMEMVLKFIDISDQRISTSPDNVPLIPDPAGSFLSRFSSSWVYSKVVTLGVSFFERERRYKDAIRRLKRLLSSFTNDGRRGYWTLRLSVNLEHLGQLNESLSVAEGGVLDPWVRAGSKMALQRRVLRLGKPPRRWKTPSFAESVNKKIKEVHVKGRPLNCDIGMKNRFYGDDGDQCGVEQLALQYYAGEGGGWQGVHTESGIWMTIFGLLMWDIIFVDIPNVFQTKFQTAPLDLDTDSFYVARKSLIESHLNKISSGMAEEILIISWQSHEGTSCRGVNWDRHCLDDLRAAVSCIDGPCLASLCRHLAQDYRSWSSGMPDLFLWRFSDKDRGEAKLVEVKGPRDRLSEQQRACLLLLMDCGFDTEVCKVSPPQPLD
ncbi:zinc ion binding/nucleic acid binding/hydrolase isoform X2 [Tasmannia lanceolata]|uniref:zinc ion binding/nucleic acid binding/hydrolase isoform X2 n=1 Tax=Tasmannia lanceolata TaxID=3420 RepID=UPI004063CBB8